MSQTSRSIFNALRLTLRAQPRSNRLKLAATFSRLGGDGGGKFLQRVGKLFRVEVGNGLRELEQLVKRGLRGIVIFQFRQRGDEAVEREDQTLGAAGVNLL